MRTGVVVTSIVLVTVLALTACREERPETANDPLPTVAAQVGVPETTRVVPVVSTATVVAVETVPPVPPTVMPTPTSTPEPKTLTVCLGAEPASLYRYDPAVTTSTAAAHIFHALYENLYTTLGFDYQAQGLAKIPSLNDGDIRLESVRVFPGDLVADADGFVRPLTRGTVLSTAAGERLAYESGDVTLTRMAVEFRLQPMRWSDGTPVTADDSRFSFELAYGRNADESARLDRVGRYEAIDDLTIRYETVPGWIDPDFLERLFPPMPRHQLDGIARSLLTTEEASARAPLASGPFEIAEWLPGDRLIMTRNPFYYRADSGLPVLDAVIFRFVPDPEEAVGLVLSGQCELLTHDALSLNELPRARDAAAAGQLTLSWVPSMVFEHIDFGINPVETYAWRRPDWFEDVRVRQAVTMCIDRQALLETASYGLGAAMHSYVPDGHPIVPAGLSTWSYDPDAANALLDLAGLLDSDGDGVRENRTGDAAFSVTLMATMGDGLRPGLTALVQQELAVCGIVVEPRLLPAGELLADGPVGTLFGRQFDLGLFAWLTRVRPPCNLYLGSAIPGPPDRSSAGWSGLNVSGWVDEAYDDACGAAMMALPGTDAYVEAHQAALRLFADNLPAIPLFARARVTLTHPGVQGLALDTSEASELWNLFDINIDKGE